MWSMKIRSSVGVYTACFSGLCTQWIMAKQFIVLYLFLSLCCLVLELSFSFYPFSSWTKRVLYKKSAKISTPKYIGCVQQPPKGSNVKKEGQPKKKYSLPQWEPDQSTKLIKEVRPSFMYNLVQDNKLLRKVCFSL